MGDKDAAHEWQGGAGGSGLTDVERQSTSVSGRGQLDDLRSGHNAMETLLEPIVQGSPVEQRPGSPPRRTDTFLQKVDRKIENAKTEPLLEGIKGHRVRHGQDTTPLEYVGDKAFAVGVKFVDGLVENLKDKGRTVKKVFGAAADLVPTTLRDAIPSGEIFRQTGHLAGRSLEWSGETAATFVRRGMRDKLGIDPGIAQDTGDLFGFVTKQVLMTAVTVGAGPAIKGVSTVGGEVLSALGNAGTSSGRLLHRQTGGVTLRMEALDLADSWQPKFWSKPREYTIKGQTNKVYSRNDLFDLKFVDPDTGLTNLQLMQKGRAPIGTDGVPVNLHHSLQTTSGPLIELTQGLHTQHKRVLHINPNTVSSGINRTKFNAWRSEYWKQRAKDFSGGQ